MKCKPLKLLILVQLVQKLCRFCHHKVLSHPMNFWYKFFVDFVSNSALPYHQVCALSVIGALPEKISVWIQSISFLYTSAAIMTKILLMQMGMMTTQSGWY